MYELEALLFSGPKEMAETFANPKLQGIFEQIIHNCGGCEEINDDPQNAPSKRIQSHYPSYKKGPGIFFLENIKNHLLSFCIVHVIFSSYYVSHF